jgi:uncharacterized membrane protein
MNATVASNVASPVEQERASARLLKTAVTTWFVTAVAGQWVFAIYVAAFYGPPTFSGDFQAWDRNIRLTDGYIAGDSPGNLFFAVHVMAAAVLTLSGALQLAPQIRRKSLLFHRWNGRVFMAAAVGAALAGLYLQWIRGTAFRAETGLASILGTTLDGFLILAFAALAWRAARARDIGRHQRCATRLFLVANGTWFLRVGWRAFRLLTGGLFDPTVFFNFWSFGAYLLPLGLYEIYLAVRIGRPAAKASFSITLLTLTALMATGTVATFGDSWRPLMFQRG